MQNSLHLYFATLFWLIPSLILAHPQFSLQAKTLKSQQNQAPIRRNLYSYEAQPGRDGRDGRHGRNADNETITIDGSNIELELRGGDGGDGEDGYPGTDARCYFPRHRDQHSTIKLPDGGSGGDGGNGGNGGNGGDLTVFYHHIQDLKQLYVRSPGGRGGIGGYEAPGGRGCICPNLYHGDRRDLPQCHGGRPGINGRPGRDGQDGNSGMLFLVKQGTNLLPEKPEATISLAQIAQGQSVALSNNIWQSHSGANTLLGNGSRVADKYREYVKRLESEIVTVWQEPRPIEDFANAEIDLKLDNNNDLILALPQETWLDTEISSLNNQTSLVVKNALAEEEATRLTRGITTGSRSDFVFSVIDQAKKSDILTTKFKIKYHTSRDQFSDRQDTRNYKTRYEGIVPAAIITRKNQRFALEIGKLPIEKKYLSPGTTVEIELTAIRSLDTNSAEQKIIWRGKINN